MSRYEYDDGYTRQLHPDAVPDMILVATKAIMAWIRSVYDATPDIDGYGHYVDLGSVLGDRVQISREQMEYIADGTERALSGFLPNSKYRLCVQLTSRVSQYGHLYATLHKPPECSQSNS